MKGFPNLLNLFDLRKMEVPPPYFDYIYRSCVWNIEHSLDLWIETNLKGRYYINRVSNLTDENKIENMLKIGFEDPKELTYFILVCPYLKHE
jgi:hypothetical protein